MARALFLVWSDPIDDEREAEFNAWYEGTHIGQVRAAIPAISKVSRYRLADPPGAPAQGGPLHRYLAIYELDTDDVSGAMAALAAAGAAGRLEMTQSMDMTTNPPVLHWYLAGG